MREYKLTTFSSNNCKTDVKTFKTIENCLWCLCEKLDVLHSLELIDTGRFVITEFKNHQYHKAYVVTVYVPFTRFYIKKLSSGSWNENELLEKIEDVKLLYEEKNERI